jgi:hypothetical protein
VRCSALSPRWIRPARRPIPILPHAKTRSGPDVFAAFAFPAVYQRRTRYFFLVACNAYVVIENTELIDSKMALGVQVPLSAP